MFIDGNLRTTTRGSEGRIAARLVLVGLSFAPPNRAGAFTETTSYKHLTPNGVANKT